MSCCGRKNNRFYTRPNLEKSCCDDNDAHACCNKQEKSSCCSNNYVRNYNSNYDYYDVDTNCSSCMNGIDGISCPFHNNNDCCCEKSLRDALCHLTNQRVIIHTDGCKMCVVIASVGSCFVKTINPCTHRIVYFNINRIDNIEDVLPRCY